MLTKIENYVGYVYNGLTDNCHDRIPF